MSITMRSDIPSYIYTQADFDADQAQLFDIEHEKRILAWLQSRPEVGRLNSGKFYIIVDGEPQYIKAFTAA